MVSVEMTYPFGRQLLRAGIYDIIDRLKGQAEYGGEDSGKIIRALTVFERASVFAFEMSPAEGGSRLVIELVKTAAGLSDNGQERALRFMADSLDQHIENSLAGREIPQALRNY